MFCKELSTLNIYLSIYIYISTYIALPLNNFYADMGMSEVINLDQEIYTNYQNLNRNSYS